MATSIRYGNAASALYPFLSALAIVVAAGLLAYLAVRAWPFAAVNAVTGWPAEPGCDLARSACTVHFPGQGELQLDAGPGPVAANRPVDVRLTTTLPAPERVRLELAGVDMNMGTWSFPLEAVGDGAYAGRMTLPACIRGRMRWRTTAVVHTGATTYTAAVDMTVGR